MARILYAWEIGSGLGHTHLLAQLAQHPRLAVHEALFAVPRPIPSVAYLDALGLAHVAVPAAPVEDLSRNFRAGDYADILTHHGYTDAHALRARIDAWRRLLDASGANLVIADSAPTLMLAARDRVPLIAAGTSFGLPPCHLQTFPALPALPDGCAPTPVMPQSRLHDIVAAALGDDAMPATTLPGWFRAAAYIPLVFPLLDPYRHVRSAPAVGPVYCVRGPLPPAPAPRVLAYLAEEYLDLDRVLDALDALPVPVDAFVRGDNPAAANVLKGRRVQALPMPFDVDAALQRASLVVHHGAMGMAHNALASGRPQLVLPFHVENTLTAVCLMRTRVALGVGYRELSSLPAKLTRALTDAGLATRAHAVAAQLQRTDWRGADHVADAVDHALAARAPAN